MPTELIYYALCAAAAIALTAALWPRCEKVLMNTESHQKRITIEELGEYHRNVMMMMNAIDTLVELRRGQADEDTLVQEAILFLVTPPEKRDLEKFIHPEGGTSKS